MNKNMKSHVQRGRKGGQAEVPKGFSKMNKRRLKAVAKAAARKRWGKRA